MSLSLHANKEIRTLTGLRGVAAIIVMLYHFFEYDGYYSLASAPAFIGRGYLGVDIFFILSGFVMALSYAHYFKNGLTLPHYKVFMVKRFARIYPLYFVIVIVFSIKYVLNLSGVWAGNYHWYDFIACLLMVQSWGLGFFDVAGATWSLSTELVAYILFPALILFTLYKRAAYSVLAVIVCTAAFYLIAASHQGVSGSLDVTSSTSLFPLLRCLAGFCLGLVGYRLLQTTLCRKLFASDIVLAVIFLALAITVYGRMGDLVLVALFLLLVLNLFYQTRLARLCFANRLVHHFGVISYSLYLVHPLFVSVKTRLEPIIERQMGSLAYPVSFALAVAGTWVTAYLLYRLVEQPGRTAVQKALLPDTTRLANPTLQSP